MKYAVIKVGGKQFRVAEGDSISVAAKIGEENKKIDLDQVLLLVEEDKVKIGQPLVEASVVGTVLEHGKAKKVKIFTYKAKTGQHRRAGHRQDQTTIKIEEIKLGKESYIDQKGK
ncbi:MAG: 50S ribosomal protein L21 [bacterium]|nr:50S ribosomal protein L21 [bacterium]